MSAASLLVLFVVLDGEDVDRTVIAEMERWGKVLGLQYSIANKHVLKL